MVERNAHKGSGIGKDDDLEGPKRVVLLMPTGQAAGEVEH